MVSGQWTCELSPWTSGMKQSEGYFWRVFKAVSCRKCEIRKGLLLEGIMKTLYLTLELLVSRVSFCVVHISSRNIISDLKLYVDELYIHISRLMGWKETANHRCRN